MPESCPSTVRLAPGGTKRIIQGSTVLALGMPSASLGDARAQLPAFPPMCTERAPWWPRRRQVVKYQQSIPDSDLVLVDQIHRERNSENDYRSCSARRTSETKVSLPAIIAFCRKLPKTSFSVRFSSLGHYMTLGVHPWRQEGCSQEKTGKNPRSCDFMRHSFSTRRSLKQ